MPARSVFQRQAVSGFVGPSNRLRATNQDHERTINRYIEPAVPGTGKGASMRMRPGLRPFAKFNDSPGKQLFHQDGRCFAIVGSTFGEIFSDGTTQAWGSVLADSNHVCIVSNGTAGGQLLITTGHPGYVFNLAANTLTQITAANFPGTGFPVNNALRCEFMDGYGIVLWRDSRKFSISALEDFTSWDSLDVAERSEGSDNLVSVARSHRELWFPGTQTGEVWYDSGDALFPFAPVQGVFLETGAAGGITASGGIPMVRYGNAVAWVGQDERGLGVVYLANGYTPQRISTHALEEDINSGIDIGYVFLYAFQFEGHEFLVCLWPELPTTWVYDLTTGLWCEWAIWDPDTAAYLPFLGKCHAAPFGKHLFADWESGIIYEGRADAYDDGIVS